MYCVEQDVAMQVVHALLVALAHWLEQLELMHSSSGSSGAVVDGQLCTMHFWVHGEASCPKETWGHDEMHESVSVHFAVPTPNMSGRASQ